MSWKLAELRWRHEVGLFESRWQRDSGALPVERKKAIEVFQDRRRRSRSLSASKAVPRSNSAGENSVSLGNPLLGALPAPRSPSESSHQTPPPRSYRGRAFSCSSVVPLLQALPSPRQDDETADGLVLRDLSNSKQPVTRYHSCSAFSPEASDHQSLPSGHDQPLETRSSILCKSHSSIILLSS